MCDSLSLEPQEGSIHCPKCTGLDSVKQALPGAYTQSVVCTSKHDLNSQAFRITKNNRKKPNKTYTNHLFIEQLFKIIFKPFLKAAQLLTKMCSNMILLLHVFPTLINVFKCCVYIQSLSGGDHFIAACKLSMFAGHPQQEWNKEMCFLEL